MELIPVQENSSIIELDFLPQPHNQTNQQKPFIEANTTTVSLSHLKNDCVIPVFAKDNEKTISHQEFIEQMYSSAKEVFHGEVIEKPEVRVSHIIKGRTPSAIHKQVKELLPADKTIYYERMAFIMRIPTVTETVNGNQLSLMVGGVRAYNQSNLYSKKSIEKFKAFVGFQNMVCCNLCVSTDGYQEEIRVSDVFELQEKLIMLFSHFDMNNELDGYRALANQELTESQFAQLIGRSKLYNYLSEEQKMLIPNLELNDRQINMVARDYYQDESFCRSENGNINLWKLYNLFTSANKSSYIDTFGGRNVNAYQFTQSLSDALKTNQNHWFLT